MKSSSLQSKTIRPGLSAYSFYRSSRQPVSRTSMAQTAAARPHHFRSVISLLLIGLLVFGIVKLLQQPFSTQNGDSANSAITSLAGSKSHPCASNNLSKFITVSISQRHLWACQGTKQVYSTAVITGMENQAADKTPVGTYQIYAKQTNLTLTGSDSTGNWSDPVSYWMPFLDNQYGTYGLHDATWRPSNAFGNISPNSSNASHGCVELPLAASKWLYNWSQVGTTVTVES